MGKTFGFLKMFLRCLGESCDTLWCSSASGGREFLAQGIVPSTVLLGRAIVFTGRGGISATCKRPTAAAGWKPRAPCQGGDIITQEQARAGSSPAVVQRQSRRDLSTSLCTWRCAHRVCNGSTWNTGLDALSYDRHIGGKNADFILFINFMLQKTNLKNTSMASYLYFWLVCYVHVNIYMAHIISKYY